MCFLIFLEAKNFWTRFKCNIGQTTDITNANPINSDLRNCLLGFYEFLKLIHHRCRKVTQLNLFSKLSLTWKQGKRITFTQKKLFLRGSKIRSLEFFYMMHVDKGYIVFMLLQGSIKEEKKSQWLVQPFLQKKTYNDIFQYKLGFS